MSSGTRTCRGSFAEISAAVRTEMEALGWKVSEATAKSLVANAPATILSWGEKITVTLQQGRVPATADLTIDSDAKAQLISWGKDDDNVTRLLKALDERLNR